MVKRLNLKKIGRHMRNIIKFICFIFLSIQLGAQEQSFTMEVSTDSVLIGNYIVVSYVLVNMDGDFEGPSFEGFNIVSGPNTSSSMSSINGDVRKQMTYSYYVEPMEQGTVSIDPAYLVSDDHTHETSPKAIHVHPNPEGIIERPSLSRQFNFNFGDKGDFPFDFDFGEFGFPSEEKIEEDSDKKPKVKVRKI